MKDLKIELNKIQGGCSFYRLAYELFRKNGLEVKLEKTWNNKKTVFVLGDRKYLISDSSYIFNYNGYLELEEFNGATRKINGETITSSFATEPYVDIMLIL